VHACKQHHNDHAGSPHVGRLQYVYACRSAVDEYLGTQCRCYMLYV
jgi:hypothetical protein